MKAVVIGLLALDLAFSPSIFEAEAIWKDNAEGDRTKLILWVLLTVGLVGAGWAELVRRR